MGYKDFKPTKVVRVPWDEMWHVHYLRGGEEAYDRVSTQEAVEVANDLWKLNQKG